MCPKFKLFSHHFFSLYNHIVSFRFVSFFSLLSFLSFFLISVRLFIIAIHLKIRQESYYLFLVSFHKFLLFVFLTFFNVFSSKFNILYYVFTVYCFIFFCLQKILSLPLDISIIHCPFQFTFFIIFLIKKYILVSHSFCIRSVLLFVSRVITLIYTSIN